MSNSPPNLFLSYNSDDREQVMRVREILHQRAINTFYDRNDLTPGMPWQDELERVLNQVQAVAVFIGSQGIGAWQRPEKELALDRQMQEQKVGGRFPVIPVLLPNAKADKVIGFLSLNTWIDLRGGLDTPEASVAIDALVRAVMSVSSAVRISPPEQLCPYRGLESFHEDDASLFFGRDKFADNLLQKVVDHPLVAVVGQSGSGKSSVVQAGLLPRLRRESWPNQTWQAVIFTPGENPFHSLAKELVPLYETAQSNTEQIIEARKLGKALAEGQIPLNDPIALALKVGQPVSRLLLVVDQFEELFRLSEKELVQPFIQSLISAANQPNRLVSVVLTLRADFYGEAIGVSRELSDLIQQGVINLGPMTRDELSEAIVQPAKCVGLSFEPGLVARLLNDLKDQPGNLPLLEFALKELWLRRKNGVITNQQYDAIGTVEGAISKRADAQLERIPSQDREKVLRVFTRLVRVSAANEEGTDTRHRVRLEDLDAAVHPALMSFAGERLLVLNRDEATNDQTVEVAHEALIRRWDALRNLLNKDREFLLWRQHLNVALSQWKRTGRDEGSLLRGVSLNEAKNLIRERSKDLNEIEREFIKESETISDLENKRPRQLALAAACIAIIILAATVTWMLYTRSDRYEIDTILSTAPELVPLSNREINTKFLLSLVLAKDVNEAIAVAGNIPDPDDQSGTLAKVALALAQARRPDDALAVANKITYAVRQSDTLADVALALAQEGRPDDAKKFADQALATAGNVTNPFDEYYIPRNVAKALALAGRPDEALAATGKITDLNDRSYALVVVAEALAQAKRPDDAKRFADQVLVVAGNITDPIIQSPVLAKGALALVQAGRPDDARKVANQALALAGKLPDPTGSRPFMGVVTNYRSSILSDVVGALAQAGRPDEALAAADKISDPTDQARTLADGALALALAGRPDDAKRFADHALAAAGKITDLTDTSFLLKRIALALAQARRPDDALAVAGNITGPMSQSYALVETALELARAGRPDDARRCADQALAAADKISDPTDQARTLADGALALAQAGRQDDAKRFADQAVTAASNITDPTDQARIMVDIVTALAQAQRPDDVKRFADQILVVSDNLVNPARQSHTLANVAMAMALAGRPDDAKRFADHALTAASNITNPTDQSSALAGVAKVHARTRSFKRAREIANRCHLPGHKLDAYTTILSEYARDRDPNILKLFKEFE